MNARNTRKLFERFSFFKPHLPITESLMGFGFECDDGWFDLIWELCLGIEKELAFLEKQDRDAQNTKEKVIEMLRYGENPFRVDQVKEKFGSLRFYPNWETEEITKLIRIAEKKSVITCEGCGAPASLMVKNSWYKTICSKCAGPEGYKATKEQ